MKAIKDPKMYCFILLVLISGDVAENPGPVKNQFGNKNLKVICMHCTGMSCRSMCELYF
jgi:hypothetical protein